MGKGRPLGSINSGTREAREFCLEIVRDPIYRENLKTRARGGTLAPQVEVLILHYAWGRPTEKVQIETVAARDLSNMTHEEMLARAKYIADVLQQTLAERKRLEIVNGIDAMPQATGLAPEPTDIEVPGPFGNPPSGSTH